MVNKLIMITMIIQSIYNESILNSQLDDLSAYRIKNHDKKIIMWIRFHSQITTLYNIEDKIAFGVIRDHQTMNKITMYFQVYKKSVEILMIYNDQINKFTAPNNFSEWHCIYFNKQIQFESAIFQQQKIVFPQDEHYKEHYYYGYFNTWQNITFSLKAYNEETNILGNIIQFKKHRMINKITYMVQNNRDQIYIQFYFRQNNLDTNQVFFELLDQIEELQFTFINNQIMFADIKEPQEYFSQNIGCQWNFMQLQFIGYDTIINLYTNQYNQSITITHKQNNDMKFFIGMNLGFYNDQIQIDNIIILNEYLQVPEMKCHPNCLKCNNTQCLKCLYNLSLDSSCQCKETQYYDNQNYGCYEFDSYFKIEKEIKDDDYQSCPYGKYFNKNKKECILCPKLQQYDCYECLFGTWEWYKQYICKFQEISTLKFIELYSLKEILLLNQTKIVKFDSSLSQIENKGLIYDYNYGQIRQKDRDIFQILEIICEKNYYLNDRLNKCIKLLRGTLSKRKFKVSCKIKFTLVHNKCKSCPKSCKICQYNFNKQYMGCIIPMDGYYVDQNLLKRCDSNCPYCFNSTVCNQTLEQQSQITILNQTISFGDCLFYYNKTCIYCMPSYFLDVLNNCDSRSIIHNFYQFELIINEDLQEINPLQIKNLILQSKEISNIVIFQIQAFCAQFQSLSNRQNQQTITQQTGCIQSQNFNSLNRCTEVEENFKYLSSCDGTYYCPNDRCTHNLLVRVTVYISNRQSIIFNDKTYYNFQDLLSSFKQQLIHIKQIQITATVYAFESIDQKCTDYNLFNLNRNTLQNFRFTKFKLILDFIHQAVFPQCQQHLIFNFDYLEINNLVTQSPLIFNISSEYVRLYYCVFQKSQLKFKITSLVTSIINTQFISLQLIDSLIEFQNNVTITDIKFINCHFIDIEVNKLSLIFINFLILNETQLQYFILNNVNINDLSIYNSHFIEINQHCQFFIVQNFKINNTYLHNTKFFSIHKMSKSQSIYQNVHISFSNFHQSEFIIDYDLVTIQEFMVNEVNVFKSKFLTMKGRFELINIFFNNIESEQSSFISLYGESTKMSDIQIYNSSFIQSYMLIVKQDYILISEFITINCNYKPNLMLISIIVTNCQIDRVEVVGLKYIGQQLGLNSLYIIQIELISGFINNLQVQDMIVYQLKILQIIYQNLEVSNLQLQNFKVVQGDQTLSHLLRFVQSKQHSKCTINRAIIQNLESRSDQQSALFLFEGKHGIVKITNFEFSNIQSAQKYYLFSCTNQKLFFKKFNIISIDQIGFIQQNNSFVDITDLIHYSQPLQIGNNMMYSIFSNLAQKYENYHLHLRNSIILNLQQPLLDLRSGEYLYFKLLNIIFKNYQCNKSLVTILQSVNQSQKNVIQFESIIIDGQCSQYMIASSNTRIQLSKIFIKNSNMGFLNATGLYYLEIQAIIVINSTQQNKNFISFSNIQGHSILNNLQLLNLSCTSIIYSRDSDKYQFKTIVQNLYLKQSQSKHLIFNTNLSLIMRQIKIKSSHFTDELFYFVNASKKTINFNNIHIQDIRTQKLFNSINSKIKVQQIHLINIKFQQDFQDRQVIYENSQSYNCTFQDQQVQIQNDILSVWNNSLNSLSPITLQFHNKSYFQQINILPNILQVQFGNSSIVYFPTGTPIEQYKQFNYKTQEQHQIYQHFAIVSNYKINLKCYLDQKVDNISGNYANINQFILKYRVNIIDNFTFLMNPYLNYTYIQNDIICEDFEYVLRFNVRILPCQLGEYLYQNQCKTCDENKFQYSVNKKASLCNLIDINKIEKAKKGQLKLKPAFWRPSIDNNQIEFCNSELCQGGWHVGDDSCVQGQVGALCKECDLNNVRGQGQYAKHDIGCLLCDFSYKLLLQGLIVIIWLMFLVYLSYDTNKQVIQQYLYFKISQRKLSDILMRQSLNQVSVITKIITNYFFYLYLMKDSLHFLYYQVNVSLNLFNNPAKLISPQLDCLLVQFSSIQIQYTNLMFNLITPLYILSSFYFMYMVLLYLKVSQFQFNFIIITIYSVYLFNQQLILESQIKLLSSITISGIDWIYLNQQYQFNSKQHYDMIYKLVLPTTILFILIPFIIYLQIQRKNKKSITIIKYYGILFREYKYETYYWEIVRIYQKFITIIFIYIYNQQNKGYLLFLFQIQLILVSYFQPYPLKNLNSLEQQSLIKLNWCLIVIFVMENIQQYFRGIIFTIINTSILLEVILQLIQKVKLQYKEQIMEVKISIVNKIPKLQRLIDMKKSQKVQQNILKVKNSFVQIKQKAVRIQAIHKKNSAPLIQDLKQDTNFEVEMTPIKYLFTE